MLIMIVIMMWVAALMINSISQQAYELTGSAKFSVVTMLILFAIMFAAVTVAIIK